VDIKGKALDQPLWKLLGGSRDRVNTYASGSLRRGLTDAQAATAARRLVDKGFVEMRRRWRCPAIRRRRGSAPRARGARCDRSRHQTDVRINQRWRVEQAIDIANAPRTSGCSGWRT